MKEIPLGGNIGGDSLGPFGNFVTAGQSGATSALSALARIVSSIIGIMTIGAGIWFLINLTVGAMQWISAGGDKNSMQNAQNRITHAFVGFIIVIAGWTILALAGQFAGYDVLMRDPGRIINSLFLR